jgi:hypothetical protein
MFFVDSGDFNKADIIALLNKTIDVDYPNLICFLDKGLFVKATYREQLGNLPDIDISRKNDIEYAKEILKSVSESMQISLETIVLYPEFVSPEQSSQNKWVFIEFQEDKSSASILSFLIYSLNSQISTCILLKPDLMKYHSNLFKIKKVSVV